VTTAATSTGVALGLMMMSMALFSPPFDSNLASLPQDRLAPPGG
jgi:hypothetical protein